jgi:hypothetical protein
MLRAGRGQEGRRYYVTENQIREIVDARVRKTLKGKLEKEKLKTMHEMTVMMTEIPVYSVLEHWGDLRLRQKDGKTRAENLAEIILEDCLCVLDDYISLAEISEALKKDYGVDVDVMRRKMRKPGWKAKELSDEHASRKRKKRS